MSSKHSQTSLKSGASAIILTIALAGTAQAGTLPGHGHFADGRGIIARSHGGLTVDQATQTGIIDWRGFSLGKKNSITFNNNGGATLNIVRGGDISRIAGSLLSNGSVYLINRTGLVITGQGRIDTQGTFAGSSHGADADVFARRGRLSLTGKGNSRVVDRGVISAHSALLVAAGRLRVNGNIEAKRHVETSGHAIGLSGASISAHNWLIDPKNLTVKSSSASTINTSLGNGTNVTLKTTASGSSGPGTVSNGPGDIVIAAPIAWSSKAALSLDAYHGVAIDDSIHIEGKGTLLIQQNDGGSGGQFIFGASANVTFDNLAAILKINGSKYKLVNSIDSLATGISAHAGGHFALAQNYNASKDGIYTSSPVLTTFDGIFEGLGHSIDNLTIKDASNVEVGLFAGADGILRDIHLSDANVSGVASSAIVGALVGFNGGTIFGASSSGQVTGESFAGGLVGESNPGQIVQSYSKSDVHTGVGGEAGGLIGSNSASIDQSFATGDVTGTGTGLILGGLVGFNNGTVTNSYATGAVIGDSGNIGGFVGKMNSGSISTSYSAGFVLGGAGSTVGGFAGSGPAISGSFTNDYWDTTASFTFTGVGNGASTGVTGKTHSQLKSAVPSAFNSAIWARKSSINGGLPYLKNNPPQ